MQLTICAERVAASCEYLVSVGLVSHIPDDAVVGRVEDIVQRHGQLHHSERRGEVSGVHREFLHDVAPQFGAQFRQLSDGELSEIGRVFDVA